MTIENWPHYTISTGHVKFPKFTSLLRARTFRFSICVWNCNTHKLDFRLRKSDLKATPCPFELDPWVFRPIPLLSIFSCSSEGGVKEQQVGTGNWFKEDPSWPSYLTMHELTQWSSHVLVRTAGANDLAGFTPQPVIGNCNRQGHRAHEKRSLVCWSLSLSVRCIPVGGGHFRLTEWNGHDPRKNSDLQVKSCDLCLLFERFVAFITICHE